MTRSRSGSRSPSRNVPCSRSRRIHRSRSSVRVAGSPGIEVGEPLPACEPEPVDPVDVEEQLPERRLSELPTDVLGRRHFAELRRRVEKRAVCPPVVVVQGADAGQAHGVTPAPPSSHPPAASGLRSLGSRSRHPRAALLPESHPMMAPLDRALVRRPDNSTPSRGRVATRHADCSPS
jgi:hypothetical protein